MYSVRLAIQIQYSFIYFAKKRNAGRLSKIYDGDAFTTKSFYVNLGGNKLKDFEKKMQFFSFSIKNAFTVKRERTPLPGLCIEAVTASIKI
jgi:hypothetical protein